MRDEPDAGFRGSCTPAQGLTGATLGFFVGFAAVSLFGPTAKSLKGIMGLSPLEVGSLVAAPSLSGSLLRIPFSAWVDTTGFVLPADPLPRDPPEEPRQCIPAVMIWLYPPRGILRI